MSGLLNEYIGNGRVLNEETLLADVRYEVRVYQKYIDASHLAGDGTVRGTQRVECTISGLPITAPSNVPLTLVLKDGLKLNFDATGRDSVKTTGGLH